MGPNCPAAARLATARAWRAFIPVLICTWFAALWINCCGGPYRATAAWPSWPAAARNAGFCDACIAIPAPWRASDPSALLLRVDIYYLPTFLFKSKMLYIFWASLRSLPCTLVNLFGSKPNLTLAIFTESSHLERVILTSYLQFFCRPWCPSLGRGRIHPSWPPSSWPLQ